mmetsp:Transcript_9416/g.31270  ORF Transcript_9416/g.31270 Transcript_9416/m.31270 type:complete len:268 (+) Transcript_9416:359-1162(+)
MQRLRHRAWHGLPAAARAAEGMDREGERATCREAPAAAPARRASLRQWAWGRATVSAAATGRSLLRCASVPVPSCGCGGSRRPQRARITSSSPRMPPLQPGRPHRTPYRLLHPSAAARRWRRRWSRAAWPRDARQRWRAAVQWQGRWSFRLQHRRRCRLQPRRRLGLCPRTPGVGAISVLAMRGAPTPPPTTWRASRWSGRSQPGSDGRRGARRGRRMGRASRGGRLCRVGEGTRLRQRRGRVQCPLGVHAYCRRLSAAAIPTPPVS